MQTLSDLLNLVNAIKQDELKEKYHPYTMRQMGWFCNPNHVFHRYRDFEIPKKSGGKRTISAPRSRNFKHLLSYVGQILQSVYEPSAHAMGFVPGKSIADNAKAHVGMHYVFNIDLKDFFPSIERARIVARLQVRPFNFTKEVALAIGGLCTMRVLQDGSHTEEPKYRYVLPQGSPASPVITNLMCDKLDYQLSGLAKRFGLNYTRYADDITFSSLHNVYQEDSDFRKELLRIIAGQGFTINGKKTRLNKVGARQEVTGLTVSPSKVNVTRKYISDLRGLLFTWEKYGYGIAQMSLEHHNSILFQQGIKRASRINVSLACVVGGKLMFLRMVKGAEDSTYLALQKRYDKLMLKCQRNQPQHTRFRYRETYTLKEFQEKMGVEIPVQTPGAKRKRKLGDTKWVRFWVNTRMYCARVKNETDMSLPYDQLCISLCENANGSESFWLIHNPYKSKYFKEKVDIDKLNEELDALISNG